MRMIKALLFLCVLGGGSVLFHGCAEASRFREAQSINTPEAWLCFLEDGGSWHTFSEEYFRNAKNVATSAPFDREFIAEAKERLRQLLVSARIRKVELRFINPSSSRPPIRGGGASMTNRAYEEGLSFFEAHLRKPVMEVLRTKGFVASEGDPPVPCALPQNIEHAAYPEDYLRQYYLGAIDALEKIEKRDYDAIIMFAIPHIEYLWLQDSEGMITADPDVPPSYGWDWDQVVSGPNKTDVTLVPGPFETLNRGILKSGIQSYQQTDELNSITLLYYVFDLRSQMRIWAGISRGHRSYRMLDSGVTSHSPTISEVVSWHYTERVSTEGVSQAVSWHYTEGVDELCKRVTESLFAELPSTNSSSLGK